jgi:hypothetical protein
MNEFYNIIHTAAKHPADPFDAVKRDVFFATMTLPEKPASLMRFELLICRLLAAHHPYCHFSPNVILSYHRCVKLHIKAYLYIKYL